MKDKKHYNIKRHVDRLYWRLENGQYKPNQNDVEAINNIVDFTNDCLSNELDQNKPFQKLYIHLLGIYMNHYENVHTAQNKVHEVLGLDIRHQYKKFQEDFNLMEYKDFAKTIGLDVEKHPLSKTEEEDFEELEIIKKNKSKYLEYVFGKWDYKKITQSLNTQMVAAYQQFKNHD